ncbi:MAG TPA: O-antigen ligase family protein [Candidatus Paceibacterota bacterium]|nr:O-antigen ligase family protein [Candidatus Paceibacterota bacterium]
MDTKYVIAAVGLFGATCGGVLLASISHRVRDVLFFLMVTMSAVTENWDVNFMSREWYRGTTCGFEVSVVDVFAVSLLVSAILVPRRGEKRWFWPASLGLMLICFLFASFCVAIAEPRLFGLFEISKLARGIIVFAATALYVRSERELKLFLLALGMIVCYEALKGIEQRYRYGIHRVFGDLNAPNSLSMYLCMTTSVFVAAINSNLSRWLKALGAAAIALAGLAVLMTVSRAGVVTLGLVLLGTVAATVSWKLTAKKVLITTLVTVAVVGALAKSWNSISSRFGESSLMQEYENKHTQGRGYYLRMAATLAEDHWFGVGPNNWSYWVSNKYGPKLGFRFAPYPGTDRPPKFQVGANANVDDPQAAPAHSLGALTVGEMGYGGLLLFTILWLRWFQMGSRFLWKRTPDPMRRIGVGIFFGTIGIFLQSLTEWVFHQTAIFFTFNIMLGTLASLCWLKKREKKQQARVVADIEETTSMETEEQPEFTGYARSSPA